MWTGQWTRKLLDILFWIRLRAASGGCRNLLRTSAREGGTETEPRIRTVRQLAAAAGDGWLGSVGSLGQLETSLNSGYKVGPCNSYLEGPTLFFLACCSRIARLESDVVTLRERKASSPIAPPIVGRAICRRSQLRVSRPHHAGAKRGASTRVPLPLTHRVAICDARGQYDSVATLVPTALSEPTFTYFSGGLHRKQPVQTVGNLGLRRFPSPGRSLPLGRCRDRVAHTALELAGGGRSSSGRMRWESARCSSPTGARSRYA